ncbi:hypothetical protein [Ralstonia pickettii]|uniref:hypothetical protein n=1 Tax=Ralstonia pickettii TaxID=329 RepID=UPI0021169D8E|nr:hypothetical protein [Ralstonia pickettii]
MSQVAFGQISMDAPLTDAPPAEALQTEVLPAVTLQAQAPKLEAAPQAQAPSPESGPRAEPIAKVEQSYWAAEGLSERMRKARAITLYLMDPALASLKAVDEAHLKDTGCEYSTEDGALIANFADTVESASVRSSSFSLQFEPREAVYLALGGGSELKLLFEKPYPNQSEVLGQINGQPVSASKSLVEGLYRWAAKVGRVRRCEGFVGRYR